MCLCIEFRFKFSNIYMSTPKILDFIKSIEKQKEWYEFITKGRKDIGFNAMIESDINMVIDQTDKSWGDAGYSSHLDDDFFNEIENKEESSKEAIEDSFKIQYGRELVKLYTLIWDTQNPIQNFEFNNNLRLNGWSRQESWSKKTHKLYNGKYCFCLYDLLYTNIQSLQLLHYEMII